MTHKQKAGAALDSADWPDDDRRKTKGTTPMTDRPKPKRILAICQQKGGTGKTTTAAAIGAGLARRGKRVLFIDLDPQSNLSYSLPTAGEVTATAFEFLTDSNRPNAIYSLDDRTGIRRFAQIMPSSQKLAGADNIITQTGKEYRLKERLDSLTPLWDYIIIDTPPGLGILTINALTAADGVIIPCQADVFSIQATGQIAETIRTVKKYCNPGLTIEGILLTRFNARQILTRETAETLERAALHLGTRLFKARIRETLAIREAQAQQKNIFDYSPDGNGARDYNALIEELTANE